MTPVVTMPRPQTPRLDTRVPYAFVHVNKCAGSSIEVALGIPKRHATAVEMRDEIGADAWNQHLTFAVVRHPLDRIAAVYFHRRRVGLGGLDQRLLSLDDWVDAVYLARDPLYNEGTVYLAPAATWVCDPSGVIVDELLHFEQLAQEWPRVARQLGVCPFLPFLNVNPHEPWQTALSDRSKDILTAALSADFDLLGYET